MGNNHYYTVGVYLEIKIMESEYESNHLLCSNGHKHSYFTKDKFCSMCGELIAKDPIMKKGFRTFSVDVMEITDERLFDSTPPVLHNTDTVIAKSNIGNYDWLRFGKYYGDKKGDQISPIISTDKANKMLVDFAAEHSNDIQDIINHPLVHGVTVRFGYVLDAEF